MTGASKSAALPGGWLSFASLGSGSKGNATLVSDGETHLLVDCGFTLREAERRLARLGLHPRQLDALLVTHEHGDHIRGVGPLARRYGVPVWLTPGSWGQRPAGRAARAPLDHPQARFAVKGLCIDPVTVPHDAREPVQFRIQGGGGRHLGLLTDLGHPTEHVVQAFAGCDALVLECNHDVRMLAEGPYPPRLKRRVGGDWGHLANTQAVDAAGPARPRSAAAHRLFASVRTQQPSRAGPGSPGAAARRRRIAADGDLPGRWPGVAGHRLSLQPST